MARREAKEKYIDEGLSDGTKRGLWVVFLILIIAIVVFSLLGLAGIVGGWISTVLAIGFGWMRFFIPIILASVIYYLVKSELFEVPGRQYLGLTLIFVGLAGVFHSFVGIDQMQLFAQQGAGGGYIGFAVAGLLQRFVGFWVSLLVLFAGVLSGFLVILDIPFTALFVGNEESPSWLAQMWHRWQEEKAALLAEEEDDVDEEDEGDYEEAEEEDLEDDEIEEEEEVPAAAEKTEEEEGEEDDEEDDDEIEEPKRKRRKMVKIPLDLLDDRYSEPNSGNVEENQEVIRETLENFNIPVEMGSVNVGPTVTQYTLKPERGVKLTKIMSLNNDLALALAAHPIRIEAPIPGKSAIGIEVPNKSAATVGLKQLMGSKNYRKLAKESILSLPLGLDQGGVAYTVALEKMPHLLVAGATGSGKSVCVNSMIVSLLYQHGPDDLKFIMVDPKRVELSVYNRIPHLLTPVITDVKKTINALKWLVVEMDRRYQVLAGKGRRNIADYNQTADDPMPYIVLIIDELADLMISAANEVETHIIRLAQMARAVGIHLVLATQRPSVDVITGLLKANIPGRIAFSVASVVDSRTILDAMGAEKLVGRGDMLFSSAQVSKPKRIQGPFVSDYEVKRVVSFLADEYGEPDFTEEVVEKQTLPPAFAGGSSDDDGDDLLEEAKQLVIESQKASTSYLQRKFRIGYSRAARLMDLLEDIGVVGPSAGAKGREVLIQPGEDDTIEAEGPETPDFEDESSDDEAEEEDFDASDSEEEDDDQEEEESDDDFSDDEEVDDIEDDIDEE